MLKPILDRLSAFVLAPLPTKIVLWHTAWRCILTQSYYRKYLKKVGKNSIIYKPSFITGLDKIEIGYSTIIRYGVRLEVVDHGQPWSPSISIGDNVNIEQNVHIVCHDRIIIGNNVSVTGHCAIVDVTHPHLNAALGKKSGDVIHGDRSFVEIGDGTFLGFGATILPNVRIGRNCMIGAGSVVTQDVPDGASAAGVPARILSIGVMPQTQE